MKSHNHYEISWSLSVVFILQDFIVIACDGLWDTVSPDAATDTVFKSLKDNKGKRQLTD